MKGEKMVNLEKLVLDYKAGNEKSFDKIYKETLPLVKSAILNYITDRETVLDLIQDTYLVFVEKRDSYNEKNFKSWIYTIAKNKALDFLKKKEFDYEDFNFDDYPEEVKEILSQCEDQDFFPNIIFTPQGEDILDAIEKMTKMSILLDYGWELAYDYDTYESEHPEAFDQDSGW